jgi:transposase-like protein
MKDCYEQTEFAQTEFTQTEVVPVCPACHSRHRQTRAGRTATGTQRYQCQDCKRHYCAENRRYRYPLELRQQAASLYQNGYSLRQIARTFAVNHQTVTNWVRSAPEGGNSRSEEMSHP